MITTIFILLIFAGGVYFIVLPFLSSGQITEPATTGVGVKNNLNLRKISLLKQIREIEFEHEMKITGTEDFERIKSELMVETGTIIDQLEQSKEAPSSKSDASRSVCPSCSVVLTGSEKFCGSCGSAL